MLLINRFQGKGAEKKDVGIVWSSFMKNISLTDQPIHIDDGEIKIMVQYTSAELV